MGKKKTLDDLLDQFKEEYPDYEIIFLTQYGSHLYGFSNENSDADYKGVYLPSVDDLILDKAIPFWTRSTGTKNSKNDKDDIDVEMFSIHNFLDMLAKGQTNALDLNFSNSAPEWNMFDSSAWTYVTSKSNKLISKNLKAFFGYCVNQATKYGIKGERLGELKALIAYTEEVLAQENADDKVLHYTGQFLAFIDDRQFRYIDIHELVDVDYFYVLGRNYKLTMTIKEFLGHLKLIESKYGARAEASANGVDLKALSHAFRILDESEELIRTGKITFPVKNTEFIQKLRRGEFEPDEMYAELDSRLDYVRSLEMTDMNILPEASEINENLRDDIVLCLYNS